MPRENDTHTPPMTLRIVGTVRQDKRGKYYGLHVEDAETGRIVNNITALEFPVITGTNEQMIEVKLTLFRPEIDITVKVGEVVGVNG
jgi:hypothetical protein